MLLCGDEPIDKGGKRHDVAINCHDVAGSEEPTVATGQSSRQFPSIRGGNILVTIVVVAAAMGLTRFASHVARPARDREPTDGAEYFKVDRSEVLRLWLPQTLTTLAQRQARSPFVRTHQELQHILERQHQKDLWYGLTIRVYQANGEFADTTYLRWPYHDRVYFQEFLDMLATAAGNPPFYPNYPTSDFSKASVHVMHGKSLEREPREVMAELEGYPTTGAAQQRFR
jgi:hypothetical protein